MEAYSKALGGRTIHTESFSLFLSFSLFSLSKFLTNSLQSNPWTKLVPFISHMKGINNTLPAPNQETIALLSLKVCSQIKKIRKKKRKPNPPPQVSPSPPSLTGLLKATRPMPPNWELLFGKSMPLPLIVS